MRTLQVILPLRIPSWSFLVNCIASFSEKCARARAARAPVDEDQRVIFLKALDCLQRVVLDRALDRQAQDANVALFRDPVQRRSRTELDDEAVRHAPIRPSKAQLSRAERAERAERTERIEREGVRHDRVRNARTNMELLEAHAGA